MDDLTVCRLSAEALGKTGKAIFGNFALLGSGVVWNPLLNAEQRWECVEWLLRHGDTWLLRDSKKGHAFFDEVDGMEMVEILCLASEFPARAVAELQLRKEDRD